MQNKFKITIFMAILILGSLACRFAQAATDQLPTKTPVSTAIPPTVTPTPSPEPMITSTPTLEPTATSTPRILPSPIACNNDACISQCLRRINKVIKAPVYHPPQEFLNDGEYTEYEITTYTIDGDKITNPQSLPIPAEYKPYQENVTAHQNIWNYYTFITPPELRKNVVYYEIFTDGSANYMAWVDWVEDAPDEWILGIDIVDAQYIPKLTYSLVHESAHLFSLDVSQMEPSQPLADYDIHQNPALCSQFMIFEGCSLPKSYINLFYQKFWKELYPEWIGIIDNTKDDEHAYNEQMYAFYKRYFRQFHDSYAATNIAEDMAVSWEFFILQPKPDASNIADKKVLFYYQFPELVEYRRQTIEAICSYLPPE